MADNCKLTAGAGGGKGLDQALETTIKGKIESEFIDTTSAPYKNNNIIVDRGSAIL